jgi:biopolymer transport protein TolR
MPRPRKSINQMNVVPYIDVMLVLLVIFMVTAPLINPGQVELPSMGAKLATPVQPLEVTVRSNQPLLLQDKATAGPPIRVSRDELVARIKQAQSVRPNQAVVIAADGKAPYQEVLGILDVLQTSGVQRVGLLARSSAAP